MTAITNDHGHVVLLEHRLIRSAKDGVMWHIYYD